MYGVLFLTKINNVQLWKKEIFMQAMIGMLMIPKSAYVWTVVIGYNAMKNELN